MNVVPTASAENVSVTGPVGAVVWITMLAVAGEPSLPPLVRVSA